MGRNRTAQRINNIHEVSQQRPDNPRKAAPTNYTKDETKSAFCGYTWEDQDAEDCDGEHTCILQTDDNHLEHECQCGEAQSAEED